MISFSFHLLEYLVGLGHNAINYCFDAESLWGTILSSGSWLIFTQSGLRAIRREFSHWLAGKGDQLLTLFFM